MPERPSIWLWYYSDRASSVWCNIITHHSDKGREPPMESPRWAAHADRAIKSYRWAKAFARINMLISFALLVYLLLETFFLSQPTALRALNLLLAFLAGFYFSWSLLFAVYIIPRDQAMLTSLSIADVPTENVLPQRPGVHMQVQTQKVKDVAALLPFRTPLQSTCDLRNCEKSSLIRTGYNLLSCYTLYS
jgi:hypothetical protein